MSAFGFDPSSDHWCLSQVSADDKGFEQRLSARDPSHLQLGSLAFS